MRLLGASSASHESHRSLIAKHMKHGTRTFVAPTIVALTIFVAPAAPGQPPPKRGDNCTAAKCHDAYGRRAFVHGPVLTESCDACHEDVKTGEYHSFELIAEEAELCAECHDTEFPGKVQHYPAAEGQCLACHDPHGSETEFLLQAPSAAELCAECHDEITEDRSFLHGPVAAGTCTACHNPHASDHAGMLFAPAGEICGHCHTDAQLGIDKKPYVHAPVEQDCTGCHDPHGADRAMMVKDSVPELCYECHDEIAEIVSLSDVGHDAVTMDDSCLNCHEHHVADFEHNLKQEPMDLCLTCHNKVLETESGPIANMKRLIEENPVVHGPIMQKECTACHEIHGGDRFRLLIQDYPPQFYAPYDEDRYALCFECHEADLVTTERTDDLTNFRNGDRNLHYLHVNRQKKGRTCRACHQVHASRQPKLITESVPFGNWEIPISYRKTATGGSCQPGCHKRYRYDRDQAVINVPRPASGSG